MSYKVNSIYFNEYNYIAVFVKGLINTEDTIVDLINYTITEMKKNNCKSVFFDLSETFSFLTTSNSFDIAVKLPEMIKIDDYRWSVFYKNDTHTYSMVSGITSKKGMKNLMLTDVKEDALEWVLNQNL